MPSPGGVRQACGSLCPNRVQDLAQRVGKKSSKTEKKEPRKIQPRSNPIAIYNDPSPESVDAAFATIDWQDLADCTSAFQQASKVTTTQQVIDETFKVGETFKPLCVTIFKGNIKRFGYGL